MLSVPPAFILSQDQTLNLICSLLLGFELTGIFLTVPFILFSLDKVFSSQMLHCSIFKVLHFRSFLSVSREVLGYLITSFSVCQVLFSTFLNFFDVVRLARTDDIISYSLPFVNIFFQKILTNGEGGI